LLVTVQVYTLGNYVNLTSIFTLYSFIYLEAGNVPGLSTLDKTIKQDNMRQDYGGGACET